jgi:hypothetical protein
VINIKYAYLCWQYAQKVKILAYLIWNFSRIFFLRKTPETFLLISIHAANSAMQQQIRILPLDASEARYIQSKNEHQQGALARLDAFNFRASVIPKFSN